MTPSVAPTAARWRLAFAALAACVASCLAIVTVEAALPPPPFAVSTDISPDGEGTRVTVRVEARPALTKPAAPEAFDLYVVQLRGFQEVLFFTGSGAWSPTPVSVQGGVFESGFAPIAVEGTVRGFGSMHVMVIGARTATDPLVRSNWLFRPILRSVPVRARRAEDASPTEALQVTGLLGAMSAVAVALVLRLSRRQESARRQTTPHAG